MRIRKNKHQGMPPEKVEALGRLSSAELAASWSPTEPQLDILRQLDQAAKRRYEADCSALAARSAGGPGSCPPPANRGGKLSMDSDLVKLVLEDGVVKQVLKRRGFGGSSAFVDWINFTIGEETIGKPVNDAFRHNWRKNEETGLMEVTDDFERDTPVTPDQVMICMSSTLEKIFGFGISHKLGYGQHFYQETWQMAEGWGTVSYGGQAGTILVSMSGKGLAAAKQGWELRLERFLETADRARITRVDLAHDFYNDDVHGPVAPFTNAGYSVDRADQEHSDGLFNCGGRNPDCEHRGNWKRPNGKGRTLTVGNRKNGKFCRIYEKGKEQGDKNSPWVRVEVELKSVDRVIPFDVLTRTGEYLATQYPALSWISDHQERILTTQKATQISVDRALRVVKHQFGAYIHHLAELFGSEEFVEMVRRDDTVPAFAKLPHYGLAEPSIHQLKYQPPPVNLHEAASSW